MSLFREPLACEGFYATRLLARRAARFAVFAILCAVALGFAAAVLAGVILNSLLVYSWGIS